MDLLVITGCRASLRERISLVELIKVAQPADSGQQRKMLACEKRRGWPDSRAGRLEQKVGGTGGFLRSVPGRSQTVDDLGIARFHDQDGMVPPNQLLHAGEDGSFVVFGIDLDERDPVRWAS